MTRGATGGVGLSGVGRAAADGAASGGAAGGAAGATNGIEPDGLGGCIGEPGATVGRAGANGARGGVLPVTPTDGNGRGVLAGPEPGIGGGSGGTSGRGTEVTGGATGGVNTGVGARGGTGGVNTGVGARGGSDGVNTGVGGRGGTDGAKAGVVRRGGTAGIGGGVGSRDGSATITPASRAATGSGIASKSESKPCSDPSTIVSTVSTVSNAGEDSMPGGVAAGSTANDVIASDDFAPAAAVANSGALTEITPPQTEQRARTPPSGTFAGSTRKIEWQSGHVTFTAPPTWSPRRPDRSATAHHPTCRRGGRS